VSVGEIAFLTGVGALLAFVVQNTEDVPVHFLFWSFAWPLAVIILVTAFIGALEWFGFGVVQRHRQRKSRRADRRD
jgi:uncharacterized integral membrane protein